MSEMQPTTTVQRAMLEAKRDQFKQAGFDHSLESQAAMVQDPGPGAKAKQALADEVKRLDAMSANAYRAAKRMQAMLDELPAEEATPDGEANA